MILFLVSKGSNPSLNKKENRLTDNKKALHPKTQGFFICKPSYSTLQIGISRLTLCLREIRVSVAVTPSIS
jgi:hypothetical protein